MSHTLKHFRNSQVPHFPKLGLLLVGFKFLGKSCDVTYTETLLELSGATFSETRMQVSHLFHHSLCNHTILVINFCPESC